jgi:hypothetical protein
VPTPGSWAGIVGRLKDQAYRFHLNDDEQTPATPWVPPTAAAGEYTDWLVAQTGHVHSGYYLPGGVRYVNETCVSLSHALNSGKNCWLHYLAAVHID